MTHDEVAAVLALLEGTPQLVTKPLYGSGVRIVVAKTLASAPDPCGRIDANVLRGA